MSAAELLTPEPAENPGTTIAEYSVTAQALAVLRQRMKGIVYDVSTTKGMEAAKKDRAEIRGYRVALENKRVEIKAPALKRAREIDSEATRIRLELEKLEAVPDVVIKAEEARKEKEREAKIAAEVARVAAIHERIAELRGNQLLTPSDGSVLISQHLGDLLGIVVDDSFQEFQPIAVTTKAATAERLGKLLVAAQTHEAEQQRLAAEREELAKQRAAQEEANRLERERIAAEQAEAKRKADAEKAVADAERKRVLDLELAQLRAQQAENERIAKEQQAAARAEQERIATENARLQAQREREDAERRERQRIEDAERQAIAERIAAQQAEIDAQRAELDRQAELAKSVAPVVEPVTTMAMTEAWAPSATDIANLVASEYGTSFDQALVWCINAFDEEEAACK